MSGTELTAGSFSTTTLGGMRPGLTSSVGPGQSVDQERVLAALPMLMQVTHDERFVTARHCLQSLWQLGVSGQAQRDAYRHALTYRFEAAGDEKNGTLVRADIVESLRRVYGATGDRTIHDTAEQLIGTEPDEKYRRKYTRLWKAGTTR